MFFVLSKTAGFLALPSNVLIVIGLIGLLLLLARYRRFGTTLVAISLVLLTVLGFSPVATLLARPLENRFPAWRATSSAPAGIVVLGGEIYPELSQDRGVTALTGSAGRLIAMVKLAREFPSARIIYSGGNASLVPGGPAEADFVGPLLDDFAIPRSRVTLETSSRNTAENAAFSKALAQPKPGERWLLVTSAMHMPRAIGCFRRVGFSVEAYPVDWRTMKSNVVMPKTLAGGLAGADDAIHEWLGLAAYWATGRISEIFPAPAKRPSTNSN
ncbi:MAG TPA: YdcF family protein [Pseudolabrys sp.]|nr:YdcF family protein [Pseudolabrys sp.]